MSGCYKPICHAGVKEVCAAMGISGDMADKMINDPKAMVCIKADGPMHCHKYKYSACPMEYSFKCGEEFDFPNPFDPTDVMKAIFTKEGNCLMGSFKGKCDSTLECIFTNNFMISKYKILGTPLCETVIHKKCCEPGNCCCC
jgi:hypothetical protein